MQIALLEIGIDFTCTFGRCFQYVPRTIVSMTVSTLLLSAIRFCAFQRKTLGSIITLQVYLRLYLIVSAMVQCRCVWENRRKPTETKQSTIVRQQTAILYWTVNCSFNCNRHCSCTSKSLKIKMLERVQSNVVQILLKLYCFVWEKKPPFILQFVFNINCYVNVYKCRRNRAIPRT